MDRILLKGGQQGVTVISNVFFDEYMIKANGEYVKVYLYLLRCLSDSDKELSIGYLADMLENTESDIIRAIKYWEGQGLLTVSYTGREIKSIQVNTLYSGLQSENSEIEHTEFNRQTQHHMAAGAESEKSKTLNMETLNELMRDGDVKMLLYVVQTYLGKTLNSTDTNIILYIYSELGFSVELTEYLVEYCVSNNHKDVKYIEKVALNWHENGVGNVDEAKKLAAANDFYPVLKAFGLSGRNPATVERAFIVKWRDEYGFDMDIIVNACNRTMDAIHQPSFQYADSILQRWMKKGVKSVSDLKVIDEEHEKEREKSTLRAAKKTVVSKPAFNNFNQRTYDYDAMEKLLLQRK
jgi:DnaD/phage-associated family protein